jgi:hypothetical protein
MVQLDWITIHSITVTKQRPTQVTSFCNPPELDRQLSWNTRTVRIFLTSATEFTVEHHLASRSYLTCQKEFRATFPDSSVPDRPTVSRLVNRLRDTGSVQDGNRSGRPLVNAVNNSSTQYNTFLFSDCNIIYFLTNRIYVRNGPHDFSTIVQ